MLAIGERYRCLLEAPLKEQTDESIIWLPDNPDLDPRVAAHADLSLFAVENHIVVAKGIYTHFVNSITFPNTEITTSEYQCAKYPKDAGLCVCVVGEYVFCNPKVVDKSILPWLQTKRVITVNQGYTRCSVCVVADDALITADCSIAHKARDNGIHALLIQPGHILLDGFDYGFIGGATIRIKNRIAFTGTISHHPDQEEILRFLARHGAEPVFLTEYPIYDIGGAVALP